jgi:transposase
VQGWSCNTTKPNTMQLKVILNRVAKQPGFVFDSVTFVSHRTGALALHVTLRARKGSHGACSKCGKKCPGYDRLLQRLFQFVPLWNIPVWFLYAPRRVNCRRCGVVVELMPWAAGKSPITTAFAWFLSSWAKVLSWTETARRFATSWHTVFAAVHHAVEWGRSHQNLDGIHCIGVDELSWKRGHKYLTLVYQIDHACKRLLWIGRDRTAATFGRFFDWLGKDRCAAIEFVASDMWAAFLGTVARRANSAVHVLDRFHVMRLFSKAIDDVRRSEARQLRARGDTVTLKHSRWVVLKRHHHLSEKQTGRLAELLRVNLRTVRAYLLKEEFHAFWGYVSPYWAGNFLDRWTSAALRSRLEPFGKLARTLRGHREPLLNWFRARGAFAMGAVEGFNLKARVTTRIAYGFRTYEHAETALYHRLGNLPEPPWLTHRFA